MEREISEMLKKVCLHDTGVLWLKESSLRSINILLCVNKVISEWGSIKFVYMPFYVFWRHETGEKADKTRDVDNRVLSIIAWFDIFWAGARWQTAE